MSHLIEEYAKSLGCKIGKPYLSDHYYPIVYDKYITFHTNDEKVEAKHYDYWSIVFELMEDYLLKEDIKIVQVGGPKDPKFHQCDLDTRGATFKQMSYIISNCLLHFGIDSLPMHIASHHDKKMVCLFSNLFPSNANPVWNKENSYKLFSPDFSEVKPSFSFSENPKRINEINPEDIAREVLSFLGIKNDLNHYKTLNIGKHYNNKIIEVVPDFIPSEELKFKNLLNLRCDYDLLEESLPLWFKRRVNLMIDKPIDINIISKYKSSIAGMTIFINEENFPIKYLEQLTKLKINYNLISKNLEDINSLRFKYFDYTIEEYNPTKKKDLDFLDQLCNNTYYHSNKVLISNNKQYYSKAAWKSNIEKTEDHQKLIDSDEFWEEAQHLNIYNHGKIKK